MIDAASIAAAGREQNDCDAFSPSTIAVIREREGRALKRYLRFGFPLPRAYCYNQQGLVLVDRLERTLCANLKTIALWPDNSMQWVLVRMPVDLAPGEELELSVRRAAECVSGRRAAEVETLRVEETAESIDISGACSLRLDTQRPLLSFSQLTGALRIRCSGSVLEGVIEQQSFSRIRGDGGDFAVEVTLLGHFQAGEYGRLDFRHELTIADGGTRVDGRITLHNPAAARHPAGLWDQGDPRSVDVDSFELVLSREAGTDRGITPSPGGDLRLDAKAEALAWSSEVSVVQHASGGANWNSPVHVDRENLVPMKSRGYTFVRDGETESGERADPQLTIRDMGQSLGARIADFWQRFPSGISATPDSVTLEFLPAVAATQELQPGERYTRSYSLAIDGLEGGCRDLYAEASVYLDPGHISRCRIPELGTMECIDPRLQKLASLGLDGSMSFFDKREMIDEYGWRHFGELYADHETDGYEGARPFVSHYNNQYDPLFGMLRQSLLTGDQRWKELGGDLARHVVDIDIYNTREDRPEYNGGLFWHTDHYLPAETATHRSFSRLQPEHAYEGHARGGGPGGQHCYTSGLLLHYLLTGDVDSRDAVYGLRHWIERLYEGSGTLADIALAVKNRHRRDLKNHLTGQYPLDRGIANYLHALLDCLTLDQAATTLGQVEHIIRNTVHPDEDLSRRNLGNVEETWYYVVFLQAVTRYLQVKAGREELDEQFTYARDALLHFAAWMLQSEAPYLDKPDILEFPNHTWTAQDLRKANVLYHAAYWSPDRGTEFAAKAREFVDYVATQLEGEPTRQYTRILALLMLNLQPSQPLVGRPDDGWVRSAPAIGHGSPSSHGVFKMISNLLRMLAQSLWPPKPSREIAAFRRILPRGNGEE